MIHTAERVKVYVDGFNLYHGMRSKHGRRYHWLNLEALAKNILRPHQTLVQVDYFTARVRKQPEAQERQATYLDALAAHSDCVRIVEGRFQEKTRCCRACRVERVFYEEKETDVSIAAGLIEDAVNDVFDAAMLISADSDLCPAVRTVRRLRPEKRIFAAFPPMRRSDDLRAAVKGQVLNISTAKIRQSQLPDSVWLGTVKLERPAHWK